MVLPKTEYLVDCSVSVSVPTEKGREVVHEREVRLKLDTNKGLAPDCFREVVRACLEALL